jgi:hypothetical protein
MAETGDRETHPDFDQKRKERLGPSSAPWVRTYRLVTIWTAVAAALTLIATGAFASQVDQGLRVFATGVVVAAAAAFSGAVIGFIFGVPRVLTSDRPQERGSSVRRGHSPIVGNTNLEQISDWLTKILVGVGLTQFAAIGRAADSLFSGLAPAFGGGDSGKAFVGGLVLYMVTLGFADGWVYTRLFLGGAMATADRGAAALDLMDQAERAEGADDEERARSYRRQARDVLDPAVSDANERDSAGD